MRARDSWSGRRLARPASVVASSTIKLELQRSGRDHLEVLEGADAEMSDEDFDLVVAGVKQMAGCRRGARGGAGMDGAVTDE